MKKLDTRDMNWASVNFAANTLTVEALSPRDIRVMVSVLCPDLFAGRPSVTMRGSLDDCAGLTPRLVTRLERLFAECAR